MGVLQHQQNTGTHCATQYSDVLLDFTVGDLHGTANCKEMTVKNKLFLKSAHAVPLITQQYSFLSFI